MQSSLILIVVGSPLWMGPREAGQGSQRAPTDPDSLRPDQRVCSGECPVRPSRPRRTHWSCIGLEGADARAAAFRFAGRLALRVPGVATFLVQLRAPPAGRPSIGTSTRDRVPAASCLVLRDPQGGRDN